MVRINALFHLYYRVISPTDPNFYQHFQRDIQVKMKRFGFPIKLCENKFDKHMKNPNGCFLKEWYSHFTPQVLIIFSRKTHGFVGEAHHFRNPPNRSPTPILQHLQDSAVDTQGAPRPNYMTQVVGARRRSFVFFWGGAYHGNPCETFVFRGYKL